MKLLNSKGQEISKLDLGIVEVGKSKRYTYKLVNDTKAELKEVKVTVSHLEVEVVGYPSELNAHDMGEVAIVWKPTLKLKQGLKTSIKITGTELWS